MNAAPIPVDGSLFRHWTRATFALLLAAALMTPAGAAEPSGNPAVSLAETENAFVLTNQHVSARINKRSGDLVSLKFHGLELLEGGSGHPYAYWSHTPGRDSKIVASATIDPASNGGERAEVSIKGVSGGTPQGNGPGGSAVVDIEIRYTLGRDDSGIYTWCILEHPADYPYTSIGEARFGAKLTASVFDFMTIDKDRRKVMPKPEDWAKGTQLNMKEVRRLNTGRYQGQVEHKYDYSAIQFEIPAFGWSGTEKKLGLWFVNPTIEYLSGGATKVELTGHLDVNNDAAPTLLNYWRGSHYGGSSCVITQGENWSRVIGPFLIYCNSGSDHEGLWKDALAKAKTEFAAWPYDWAKHTAYTPASQRGAVSGQLTLKDPQAPGLQFSNLLVGVAAPDYALPSGGRRGRFGGEPQMVDWQMDAKFYEFWTRGSADGKFTIPKVRPGTYTLHAITDGVLGEFAQTEITVAPGQTVDLGSLTWTPVRHGRQLWDIGIANRSGAEFRNGDHFWQWGLYYEYAKEFPDDLNFTLGKSNFRSDWNFLQATRKDRPDGTPWTVNFDLSEDSAKTLKGDATLRGGIKIQVNGASAGETGSIADNATIRRDGVRGYWNERDVVFPASLLRPGTNTLTLTIPPGGDTSGVIYDYLRLEANP